MSLVELCEANGFAVPVSPRDTKGVKEVRLFQTIQFELSSIAYFPELTELEVIQAPLIKSITGLDTLRNLRRLWLSECKLTAISGLSSCVALQTLNLDGNRIEKIEGLDALENLEELWLNSNCLRSLSGLESLFNLRQLWVARNQIDHIGNSLDSNTALEELNLSDNRIGSFKELDNLGRLPSLSNLALNDPHFGPNPVCNLCNYQTYVMFQLSQVTVLDASIVLEDSKQLAEATFMKKRMYYNMRIKTLKRNTTNVIKQAQAIMQSRVGQLFTVVADIERRCQDIVRELESVAYGLISAPSSTRKESLKSLEDKLKAALKTKHAQIEELQARFRNLKSHLLAVSDQHISRMMLELTTGGNIRLEDGKPGDVWYASCVDLVHSRFHSKDFATLGIRGVKVHRVTRIHNRYLRNRFDKRVSDLLACNPGLAADIAARAEGESARPGRRALEYLFYSVPWPWGAGGATYVHAGSQVQRIAEDGFTQEHASVPVPLPPLPDGYLDAADKPSFAGKSKSFGKPPPPPRAASDGGSVGIPLTNSMSIADMPRICEGFARVMESNSNWSREGAASGASAARVRLTGGALGTIDCGTDVWLQSAGISTTSSSRTTVALDALRGGKFDNLPAVERGPAGPEPSRDRLTRSDIGQGLILICKVFLGNCLASGDVMETGRGAGPDSGDDSDGESTSDKPKKPSKPMLYHSVVVNRTDDVKQRQWVVLDPAVILPEYAVEVEYEWDGVASASDASSPTASGRSRDKDSSASMTAELAALATIGSAPGSMVRLTPQEEADLRPLARPLARFTHETKQSLSAIDSEEGTLSALLSDADKSRGSSTVDVPSISVDDISRYLTSTWPNGQDVTRLRYLNLHGCSIKRISGLSSCVSLEVLVLSFNQIQRVEGLTPLSKLERLDLSYNKVDGLELGCLVGLARLATLDMSSNQVHRLEDVNVLHACVPQLADLSFLRCPITEAKGYVPTVLAKLPGLTMLDGNPVSAVDRVPVTSVSTALLGDVEGGEPPEDPKWLEVDNIDLSHRLLKRLSNLSYASQLRKACFNDNEIAKIEGLNRLTLLEELSLEENRISSLDGLESLKSLRKLDVGKNMLTSLDALANLPNLCQLSVEDNLITSLAPLSALRNLMELYIGNNDLDNIKDVRHLKDLPKLIISDFSGNSFCSVDNYRLFTIYYLRRLKVLDGIAVDPEEQGSAKEVYSGRLTIELLEEKIGHSAFDTIRELDLSSSRIREIEALSSSTFRCLSYLNLDNNDLSGSGIVSLRDLPHLSVLRLNNNRITALMPPTESFDALSGGCFGQLEVLQLGFNRITDIAALGLDRIPELKVLYLHGNEINRIIGLNLCTSLRELVLDKNKIKTIDPGSFVGLSDLRELRLQENGLKSLNHFGPLTGLQVLALGHNRVNDVTDVDKLASLPNLVELWLNSNPVSRKQLYRPAIIRKLEALASLDGREITAEERERAEALFSGGDGRPTIAANVVQDPRMQVLPVGRVPLQLTSVNFESLSLGSAMGALAAAASEPYAPVSAPPAPMPVPGAGGASMLSIQARAIDRRPAAVPTRVPDVPGITGVGSASVGMGIGAGRAGRSVSQSRTSPRPGAGRR